MATTIILSDGTEITVDTTVAPATGSISLANMQSHISPGSDSTFDLGTSSNRWRDLYLSGNSLIIGDTTLTSEAGATGGLNVTATDGGGQAKLNAASVVIGTGSDAVTLQSSGGSLVQVD